MKTIITFSFILLLCSCNTYQYITVSSPGVVQDSLHRFVVENDTMKLTYNFSGRNGPMQFTIFNKLDKPLLIDLNRSALIINNKAIGLYNGQISLTGSFSGTSSGGRLASFSSGSLNATGTLPQGVIFIPSNSYISQAPAAITDRNIDNIPEDKFQKSLYTWDDNSRYKVQTADFSQEASPVVFRTYLTFIQPDKANTEITQQRPSREITAFWGTGFMCRK